MWQKENNLSRGERKKKHAHTNIFHTRIFGFWFRNHKAKLLLPFEPHSCVKMAHSNIAKMYPYTVHIIEMVFGNQPKTKVYTLRWGNIQGVYK